MTHSAIKSPLAFCAPVPVPHHVHSPPSLQPLNRQNQIALMSTPCPSSSPLTSRRIFLTLLLSPLIALPSHSVAASSTIELYDPIKSRRYINTGRPKPDAEPPKFSTSIPVFSIDEKLQAQDITSGTGDVVAPGNLVSCRWLVRLEDGTTIDDINIAQPSLFRPGSHQVPPGIEDSVIGMRARGQRRVSGSAERILTYVKT